MLCGVADKKEKEKSQVPWRTPVGSTWVRKSLANQWWPRALIGPYWRGR